MNVIFASSSNGRIEGDDAHTHECYEIIVVLEGCCNLYIDDEEFSMNENSVVVIPPGVVHGSLSADSFRDLYIRVDEFPAVQDTPVAFSDQTDIIRYLGQLICTTWLQKDYNYRAITSALLAVINQYVVKYKEKGCEYGFVQRLQENIANGFSDSNFSLKNAHVDLRISKDYLRHCFKKETGLTPSEYLTNMRIRQAKLYLLQDVHMSQEQIATECGFKDSYYFSRCFKKKMGVSPSEFRKLNKN